MASDVIESERSELSLVPEVGIALEDRGRRPKVERRKPAFGDDNPQSGLLVPEVGIEPTRGVTPTGF